jgi:hypothetical protein
MFAEDEVDIRILVLQMGERLRDILMAVLCKEVTGCADISLLVNVSGQIVDSGEKIPDI